MTPIRQPHDASQDARRKARRTAWLVGGAAALVYVGILLKALLAR